MTHEVKLPQLTETMEYAMVIKWFKNVGEHVGKKEPLYEVETDKVTMEVESIDEGYLCRILVGVNEEVTPGSVLALLSDTPEGC